MPICVGQCSVRLCLAEGEEAHGVSLKTGPKQRGAIDSFDSLMGIFRASCQATEHTRCKSIPGFKAPPLQQPIFFFSCWAISPGNGGTITAAYLRHPQAAPCNAPLHPRYCRWGWCGQRGPHLWSSLTPTLPIPLLYGAQVVFFGLETSWNTWSKPSSLWHIEEPIFLVWQLLNLWRKKNRIHMHWSEASFLLGALGTGGYLTCKIFWQGSFPWCTIVGGTSLGGKMALKAKKQTHTHTQKKILPSKLKIQISWVFLLKEFSTGYFNPFFLFLL